MKTIKKILVPTDFSRLSVAAVEHARVLARAFRAEVCLLYVVDVNPVIGIPNVGLTYDKVSKRVKEGAMGSLKTFARKHLRGVRKLNLLLGEGTPHEEIVRVAHKHRCDLIVMATHGHTGLASVLIGSVAERVVRHSDIPVLLLRPKRM
jgi:nucleotide-binding universal stress UspA family protein